MRAFLVFSLLVTTAINAQFAQQGSKLRGMDASGAMLGTSLAISFDGNTAVAGGPPDHSQAGAAWIFTRDGKTWTQQGARLVGTDAGSDAHQGTSVSISADGNTVLIGGPRDRLEGLLNGAAWVFTRDAGVWTQQGAKLLGSSANGEPQQGTSVAISADGNTAIIGGPYDNASVGASWIFTRTNGVWSQQGSKLVGFGASAPSNQGLAVAISGDGNTVLVGGPNDLGGGSAWIFTRTNGVWSQQVQLIAIGGVGTNADPVRFGSAVALSNDGNTAVVGGPDDDSDRGAIWLFVRSGTEWSLQGNKLVGGTTSTTGSRQGTSVAISFDGDTVVSGGPTDDPEGGIWIFTRTDGVWSQLGSKLSGGGAATNFGSPKQGSAVAISGNATTIIESGAADSLGTGSIWPFAKATVTIATSAGNRQSAQVNTAFAPLTAIVSDATDQPVSGASVTFTITPGTSGASGSFASSSTVVTNGNGFATAPTLTANNVIGGFSVVASTPSAPASAIFNLANAALPSPSNLVATATPSPSVSLTWSASSGATMYEIVRSDDGITFTTHGTTSDTAFVDSSSIFSNSAHLYKVRAIAPAVSGYTAPDLATVVQFTDSDLAGVPVKAVHFTELRQAVSSVRGMCALDPYSFTDSSLAGEPVKAIHIDELRSALDEARARLLLSPAVYTRTITAGTSTIAAADVNDLRNSVK